MLAKTCGSGLESLASWHLRTNNYELNVITRIRVYNFQTMINLSRLKKSTGSAADASRILSRSLREIREEIQTEKDGLKEFETLLSKMENGRDKCAMEAQKLRSQFEIGLSEDAVGKVMLEAGTLQAFLEEEYKLARERHAQDMQTLSSTFDYHAAYKRGIAKREFTGTYFTPVRDPKRKH
jgi:hypothetical protein